MISIIIPTLNEEKVLKNTLLALRKLNSIPYEIIVSDGGSTDKTLEIAEKYADKVVKNEKGLRQTIGMGKNLGAKVAQGELYIFLDADVEIPDINTFVSKAVNLFKNDKNLVGLVANLKVFPEHATLSDKFFFRLVNATHYISNNWLKIGSASGEFQMIRSSGFKQVGGYDESLIMGEDNRMFVRLAKVGTTRFETGLHVLHTARRAHKTGWVKLLSLWMLNNVWNQIFKRSYSKEWTVIR